MGNPTLPSALSGFTSEFEMGSGGTRSLWPPGKTFTIWKLQIQYPVVIQHFHVCDLVALLTTQTTWVLYGQAARAISTG